MCHRQREPAHDDIGQPHSHFVPDRVNDLGTGNRVRRIERLRRPRLARHHRNRNRREIAVECRESTDHCLRDDDPVPARRFDEERFVISHPSTGKNGSV